MPLWLLNIAGWIAAHWRLVAVASLAVALLITLALLYRGCGKSTPKLDPQEIIKAQKAIAEQDREEMTRVLVESDAKEAVADETEINANAAKVNAIAESKAKWAEASNAEMQEELERRARESQ